MFLQRIILLSIVCLLNAQDVIINEIVPSNGSIIYDEDDETPDWIEIYNPSNQEINLGGFFISDDNDDLGKWTFPSITIAPSDFLVLFASDKIELTLQYNGTQLLIGVIFGVSGKVILSPLMVGTTQT